MGANIAGDIALAAPSLALTALLQHCPSCCSVLMGANIAGDIARGELSEATVGFNVLENAVLLQVRGWPGWLAGWPAGRWAGRGQCACPTATSATLSPSNQPQDVFERPHFYVQLVPDVVGAEMCGTLKNVVAMATGFVEGLGLGEEALPLLLPGAYWLGCER